MNPPWQQITIGFPDWNRAEHTAATHLAPLLTAAETTGTITGWFFLRKAPHWRLRYRPAHNTDRARDHLHRRLAELHHANLITNATDMVYEPETRAFGGAAAMATAHRLWHRDSRHLLTYLADPNRERIGRRELSILLTSTMLRAAHLDWYEQGDVWHRVTHHRDPPEHHPTLDATIRRLLAADTASLTRPGRPLAFAADWAHAYTTAGHDLADLAGTGRLHRGLRAVLAHHIIFAWNRIGLSTNTQAALAGAAATAVFGPDPTTHPPTEPPWARPASPLDRAHTREQR